MCKKKTWCRFLSLRTGVLIIACRILLIGNLNHAVFYSLMDSLKGNFSTRKTKCFSSYWSFTWGYLFSIFFYLRWSIRFDCINILFWNLIGKSKYIQTNQTLKVVQFQLFIIFFKQKWSLTQDHVYVKLGQWLAH